MISAVQGRFANLGMAKKMGIGFTLVLLLTGVVAAIGVWSLQAISLRFDGLKQMSSLNSSLLKVRLSSRTMPCTRTPRRLMPCTRASMAWRRWRRHSRRNRRPTWRS